jgi:hypothetical protein
LFRPAFLTAALVDVRELGSVRFAVWRDRCRSDTDARPRREPWSDDTINALEGFQNHRQNFRWHALARPAMETLLRFAHRKRLTSGNAFNPVGSTWRNAHVPLVI